MVMLTRSILLKNGEEIWTTLWVKSPIETNATRWREVEEKTKKKFVQWMMTKYPTFQIVGFKKEQELTQ